MRARCPDGVRGLGPRGGSRRGAPGAGGVVQRGEGGAAGGRRADGDVPGRAGRPWQPGIAAALWGPEALIGVWDESNKFRKRVRRRLARARDLVNEGYLKLAARPLGPRPSLPDRGLPIYLMCESKKGMSANQLKRTLGVTYRTAWHLCHRIREAMGNDPLAGAIQREGDVRLEQIPDVKKETLHEFIGRTVKDEAEAIYTDELKSYLGIADDDTRHETVNHSIEEWVVGDVHTNGIEGVWSLFKRSIVGTFHKMSRKHMDRYLEELEWRFNCRSFDLI